LKNLEKYGNGHYTNLNGKYGVNYVNHDTLKSQLDKQSLIIDYFITDDTLYVFMLNHEKLQLLKKAIQMDVLKETVYAYKDSINKTEQVFQDYNLKTITTHFEGTTQLGHKLFHDLMGWPILIESLEKNELLYIIPDEFLYELPFETLVVNTKKPLTYLVNKSAVKQIPGTSFLYSTVENVDQDFRHKKVLISADLDFTGVGDLISFVKSNFPFAEEIQVNREPTKQDVLDKLDDGYEIIIIIGHGLANAKYPEFSNLQFSITNSKTNTSKKIQLTIADLKQVSWSGAEMVILVGCETAGGWETLPRNRDFRLTTEFYFYGCQECNGEFMEN